MAQAVQLSTAYHRNGTVGSNILYAFRKCRQCVKMMKGIRHFILFHTAVIHIKVAGTLLHECAQAIKQTLGYIVIYINSWYNVQV